MTYHFTAADIDSTFRQAEAFLEKCRGEKTERKTVLLWLEETLLTYRDQLGEQSTYEIHFGKTMGGSRIKLTVHGEMLDPYSCNEDPDQNSSLMRSFLTTLNQRPAWRYVHGRNEIVFSTPKKRMSSMQVLLLSVVSAVVLGALMHLVPEGPRTLIQYGIIEPAIHTFMGFLNAIAMPMIFLSVVWGIYSMGDTATFNRIGSKVCSKYMLLLSVLTALMVCLSVPFLRLETSSAVELGSFSGLYELLLDIVPDNLFTPFSRGNTLQILFVAVMIGITMIVVSDKTQSIAIISEQLNCIVQTIMSFVGRLVPFFIFGTLFVIISAGDLSPLASCSWFFIATLVSCAVLLAAHTLLVCIKLKISPKILWKKAFPTFMIGLTTSSSSAAFASNLSTAREKFGVSEKLANFGVPVGQVLYKPGVSAVFLCSAVSVANQYGIKVSATWFISAAIMCILLSVATPTIPGGTAASFSILFSQLGLPSDQMAMILALNTILDFFHTATNLFGDQCVLLLIAEKNNMLDRTVLESDN